MSYKAQATRINEEKTSLPHHAATEVETDNDRVAEAKNLPTSQISRKMQPQQILALQRTYGNQAVMRMLRNKGLLNSPAARTNDASPSQSLLVGSVQETTSQAATPTSASVERTSESRAASSLELSSPAYTSIERSLDMTVQRIWPFSKKEKPQEETAQNEPDPVSEVQAEQAEAEAAAQEVVQGSSYLKALPANTEFVTESAVNGPEAEAAEEAKPSLWKRIKNVFSPGYTAGKVASAAGTNVATAAGATLGVGVPGASIATGAVDTGLGAYSTYSSSKKAGNLNAMADEAKAGNSDLTLPLRYAAAQKAEKAMRRGVGTVGSALTTAGGVIGVLVAVGLMASNPIGWALLLTGGIIAGGLMLYRLGRKYFKTNRGIERRAHAKKLHLALVRGDNLAKRAVQELGLNVTECTKPGGERLIKKKLKSI